MDVLCLNTYGGSLLLGARAAGFKIRGSYEDSGFGSSIQRLNFPTVNVIDHLPWPKDDLANTLVIAHPPCSGFSSMTYGHPDRGTRAPVFECHKRVMIYALGQNCAGLAIESVLGALNAADTYNRIARRYGYAVFFVTLNAASFGVPQWRQRFWALFLKRERLFLKFAPVIARIEDVMESHPRHDPSVMRDVHHFQAKFKQAKFDFQGYLESDYRSSGFCAGAAKFLECESSEVPERTGVSKAFGVYHPVRLNPLGFAPVLLGASVWFYGTRALSRIEYQRVMGFPDDYQWPLSDIRKFRMYLSKGVCPPIASWILKTLKYNQTPRADFTHSVAAGEVLNLRPKAKDYASYASEAQLR